MSLDISMIGNENIQQLCMNYDLFSPLIYICNHVDQDYVTPLIKMIAYHQVNHQSVILNKNLWYIRMIFRGFTVPNL